MKDENYRKISTGLGQEIRDLMNDAIRDARYLPGRKELNERLLEMLPDDSMAPVRESLATKFKQYAEKAQDRGSRFELRGRISQLALHVVTELEKGDRLVPVQEEEVVDVDALLEKVAEDGAGGEYSLAEKRKRDAEYNEAERIRGLQR